MNRGQSEYTSGTHQQLMDERGVYYEMNQLER